MKYCFTFFLVVLCRGQWAQIVRGPTSQTVLSGDTAVFNCSLECGPTRPLTWYITLPTTFRTITVSPYTRLDQLQAYFSIEASRNTVNECSKGGYLVEQLFVKASKPLHLMPVQCSTVCFDNDCGCRSSQVYFSRAAILGIVENTFPAPSPSLHTNTLQMHSSKDPATLSVEKESLISRTQTVVQYATPYVLPTANAE